MSVRLGEGQTPLVPAARLSARTGIEVWLKLEGANPTGSFKDRGMALAVTRAVERGLPGVACASTGNTAASAAAYAARAGIAAAIVVPAGAVSASKLVQARAVGARVVEVRGSFSESFAACLELAEREGFVVVNSTNADRIEGQASAAAEVVAELGGLPDAVLIPYGGGGNTIAYARGFEEAAGRLPRLCPAQAERRVDTFASAIRIVEPVHSAEVEAVVARSGGALVTLGEEELERAWRSLATEEGIFCEPASAAGAAALARGIAQPGERVVCVITGHGLKDPDAVARAA